MSQNVVASLPLGWVALAVLLLIVVGICAGWLMGRITAPRGVKLPPQFDRQRFTDLLSALPQAALITDTDSRVIARNLRAAQLLQDFGRGNDLPLALDAAVGRVIRTRVAETLEIKHPVNSDRRWQVSVSPLQTGGQCTETLVLLINPAAGSGRADAHRRLISLMAHELRTPLTSIMGHVEILNSARFDEEALWRRSLSFVSSEVERLGRLVEDLLSLSRLDQIPLHRQPMNLRLAAEEALSALYSTAERAGVSLVLQAPAELPRVEADADRIRQVFLNLLDNAIKYAPDTLVTIRLMPVEQFINVEVKDTGPGIASEDLPHIFEPMYRSKHAPSGAKGSGLGLTIVRTILDQHNAPIRVHSVQGQGTAFTFSLSVAHSDETRPHQSDLQPTQRGQPH